MTPKQADLIRRSFDAIWPVRRKIASRFYRCFFELAPDAQRLFPSDMERQHLKLMDMIAAIVGALDERELFQSIISHTGRQHARFGVNPSHFVAFGDALIWSLEQQFGPAFTPELREAWITLYNAVRSEMIRAAQEAATSKPRLDGQAIKMPRSMGTTARHERHDRRGLGWCCG
jgi:hemoglobin-like flavoprotein